MSLSARAQWTPRSDLGRFVDVVINPGVTAAVIEACGLIETAAKGYCPVDTGALRDSIATTISDTGKTVVGAVAPNVPYAEFVEFGTGIRGASSAGAGSGPYSSTWPGMAAQPYMRPALDENRSNIVDLFRSNISLAL